MKRGGKFFLIIFGISTILSPNFVFAVSPIWQQTNFWFREDNGNETAATGFKSAAQDVSVKNISIGADFRLRFGLRVVSAGGLITPQLEFKEGTDCGAGAWQTINAISGAIILKPSSYFTDGDATTQQITSGSFAAGKLLESTNPASSITLSQNQRTEYEWSLNASSVKNSATYAFRITDAGTPLGSYNVCPLLTIAPPPPVQPKTLITAIKFFGRAYPLAKVTILEKVGEDATPIRQETISSAQGFFAVEYSGKFSGNRTYGVLIEDKDGSVTPAKFFNFDIGLGAYISTEIFAAPTIGLRQTIARPGSKLTLFGYATPKSNIHISINGQTYKDNFLADDNGFYEIDINTGSNNLGTYAVKTKQADERLGKESDWSIQKTFTVAKTTVLSSDLNKNGIIDISDWSIFLTLWGKSYNEKKQIDLNGDGKVDISDFSLFVVSFKK